MHNESKTLDTSLLSKEQQEYICKGPDIQRIVELTENYTKKVQFVEKAAAEIKQRAEETVERLHSLIEEKAMNLMNQLIFD